MGYSLDRHRIDKIPQEVVVEELQRVAAHYHHRYFTAKEFDAVAVRCKATTALPAFGSWRAAIEAAGPVLRPYKKPRIDQVPEHDRFVELERIWKVLGHRPSRAERESSSPRFRCGAVSDLTQLALVAEGDSLSVWTSATTWIRRANYLTSAGTAWQSTRSRTCFDGQWRIGRGEKDRGWPWVGPRQGGMCASSTCLTPYPTPSSSSRRISLGPRP